MEEVLIDHSHHEGHKPDDEAKWLLEAYAKVFDVWKVQNENYFKRVQVFMGIVQVGLLLAVLKGLEPLPTSWCEAFLPIFLVVLGIFSAYVWTVLNKKQRQYIEFCRRNLRNIEARLGILGVPLEYFTLESLVFGSAPNFNISPYSAKLESVQVRKKERCVTRFLWTQDTYPDPDSKSDRIYRVSKVSGGVISIEGRFAWGALFAWLLLMVVIVVVVLK